jgi:hypothetical protein
MARIPDDYTSKVGDEASAFLDEQSELRAVRRRTDYEQETGFSPDDVYAGDDEVIRNVPVRSRRGSDPVAAFGFYILIPFASIVVGIGFYLMYLLARAVGR